MRIMQGLFRKYVYGIAALALTIVASSIATRGCYFIYYQPKAPENLKDFSLNK